MSKHITNNRHKRTQTGFTLVEVMVALVIIAVALPAMMSLIITQANNATSIREQTLADWVATNQLNTHRLNYQLTQRILNGRQTGTEELSGIEWHWLAVGEETPVEEIRRINISVGLSAEEAADNPISHLSGFIYEIQDDITQ